MGHRLAPNMRQQGRGRDGGGCGRGKGGPDGLLLLAICGLAGICIVFGLAVSGPVEVFQGLAKIFFVRDTLITDYMGAAALGRLSSTPGF